MAYCTAALIYVDDRWFAITTIDAKLRQSYTSFQLKVPKTRIKEYIYTQFLFGSFPEDDVYIRISQATLG